jgi:arylsulfatase A-like enzyme
VTAPIGMGFEYFYGFMGGETDQWTPYLFQNTTQITPWVGKPGYNLTTDLADEAIKHMKALGAAAPDKPFFVYYVPGGTHSPHQPTQEWIDKFKGKFESPGRGRSTRLSSGPSRWRRTSAAPARACVSPGRTASRTPAASALSSTT